MGPTGRHPSDSDTRKRASLQNNRQNAPTASASVDNEIPANSESSSIGRPRETDETSPLQDFFDFGRSYDPQSHDYCCGTRQHPRQEGDRIDSSAASNPPNKSTRMRARAGERNRDTITKPVGSSVPRVEMHFFLPGQAVEFFYLDADEVAGMAGLMMVIAKQRFGKRKVEILLPVWRKIITGPDLKEDTDNDKRYERLKF
ncbi:hypothetical protein BJ508DRAFT_331900 [Ascobolus immersus RN42]|uniref:Uncharacterized protein n=1 Tax=Ascobolus immersus RN42 TaxID=1160509 RepID=A0A3N4HRS7_ASCIM|nr:hypothetical protein BJ508DRAFT_331900 [Ascobolus immersus RN42]